MLHRASFSLLVFVCGVVRPARHWLRRIQYLFIPEGNKTHAMYWATEYWIPELVRRQVRCQGRLTCTPFRFLHPRVEHGCSMRVLLRGACWGFFFKCECARAPPLRPVCRSLSTFRTP